MSSQEVRGTFSGRFFCVVPRHLGPNLGFCGGSVIKNPPPNAEDRGTIPGSRRSPGEGKGNPLQYSCLGNPMDRGAWWATVLRVAKC